MFQKLLNNYWLGVFGRFSVVGILIGIAHLASRPVSVFFHQGEKVVTACEDRSYSSYPYSYYGSSNTSLEEYCRETKVPANWYEYISYAWWQHILYFVIGAFLAFIVLAVVGALFYGIGRVICYVFGLEWPFASEYVDPCKNPQCPCQRHVVEREEAERAQQLAMTVAVSAATSAAISSISS